MRFALPPKVTLIVLVAYGLSLGGCGGGSSAHNTGLGLATTTTDIAPQQADNLFASFRDFPDSQQTALVMNVSTGALSRYVNDASLVRFLNKQPDPLARLSWGDEETSSYVALSHLSHNLAIRASSGLGLLGPDSVNTGDPGQFFLFGHQGPAPQIAHEYQMTAPYYCSFCTQALASSTGVLSLDPARGTALLSLRDEGLSVSLPLLLAGDYLIADQDSSVSLTYQGEAIFMQVMTGFAAGTSAVEGRFYGPEAEQAGIVFALSGQKGLLSGAAIGKR